MKETKEMEEMETVPVAQVQQGVASEDEAPMGRRIAARFGLERDGGWERHSNPASVWTRFAALPLLVGSIWSREWIGWWCLVPIGLSLVWMAVNPLVFDPPTSTRHWASKAVFGERIFVQRDRSPIPEHFGPRLPQLIQAYQVIGLIPLVYGLIVTDVATTVMGLVIIQSGKLWYLDRMVLLFEDMKARRTEYAAWEHGPIPR